MGSGLHILQNELQVSSLEFQLFRAWDPVDDIAVNAIQRIAEEAGNILHQIDPDMNVSSVMESLVNGLWEDRYICTEWTF